MIQAQGNIFIIIVSYNGMKWLPKCLKSTKPYPVIVIDNCSNDGTKEFIKASYPEVVLLEQEENLGFGQANNIGIAYALKKKADFVFLLNQDAYLEPTTINILHKTSIKNPDYGILSPIHLNGEGTKMEQVFSYYFKRDSTNNFLSDLVLNREKKEIYYLEMVNAAAWLLPRKTLDTVGGFHPMFFLYGEDDNYCQRVKFHDLKVGICPQAFIKHDSGRNYHEEQKKGTKEYYDKFLNQIKVKYGNVNGGFQDLQKMKLFYLRAGIKSLLKFKWDEGRINLHKRKLIGKLDFTKAIAEGKKKKRNYLDA